MVQEPKWEMTEHGWHGVAVLTSGYQWHAYVEHVDAPQHSTWAGCTFESLREAQEWCKTEIVRLRAQHGSVGEAAQRQSAAPPRNALGWLWETLGSELGETRTREIREEFARRQSEDRRGT